MALKLEFVKAARAAGGSVAAACRTFGISRQTGHKWLRRFEAMGYDGLAEQSRRPVSTTGGTSAGLVQEVLALRARRPKWGAKTIVGVLKRKHGPATPSVSTVTRVLRRYGHLQPRRAPVRVWAVEGKAHVEVHACNDLWTIDFKGWWLARSRERCEPLTVRDAFSKLVLATALVPTTSGAVVRRHLVRLFRRHGVPRAIWVDNGTPWICMRSRGGLTQLSAWLVALGIEVHRSRVGCPQDNGGHERMHRDLAVLEATPAATRRAQQRMCDRWRVEFNRSARIKRWADGRRRRSTRFGTRRSCASACRPTRRAGPPGACARTGASRCRATRCSSVPPSRAALSGSSTCAACSGAPTTSAWTLASWRSRHARTDSQEAALSAATCQHAVSGAAAPCKR